MKKKLVLLSLIIPFIFSSLIMSPVGAQDVTMGVEPPAISDEDLVAGLTFTVEIWIRNVADLAGYEFKLGYDTAVLTATSVTYGGIFDPNYFELGKEINDAEGWVSYGCMEMFGEPGFDGDGRAAIIDFTVDDYGASPLDLYDTELGDSYAVVIPHTVIDGYFSNKIPGDFDGDGYVGPMDFATFAGSYGTSPPSNPECDFDGDGYVGPMDFATFAGNYGRSV